MTTTGDYGESRAPGYQADGTYVPCAECGHVEREPDDPPFAVSMSVLPRTPGTVIHKGNCPLVTMPPDVQRHLYEKLAEMDRVRRRGAAEAMFHVIG